jgi:hypothetical protein
LEALRWVSVVAGFRGAGVLVGELLMMVMMEERDREGKRVITATNNVLARSVFSICIYASVAGR